MRIHRTPTLRADEITEHQAIRVTAPARTLLDLAATHCPAARSSERSTRPRSASSTTSSPSKPSLEPTRATAEQPPCSERSTTTASPTLTDSELEELMLALCHDHRLAQPIPQAWVAGLRVDFLFVASRLVVETDGYRFHRTRRAFERDRERDAILARAGYRTLRFTHRQLTREPAMVAETITK